MAAQKMKNGPSENKPNRGGKGGGGWGHGISGVLKKENVE